MRLIVLINHSPNNCTVWSFPVLAVVSSPVVVIIPKAFPVQFNHSVVSNSLWPSGLQHARPPCPSPTPGVTDSCLLSWWRHQPSHPLSFPSPSPSIFPSIRIFSMSQLFSSGGQSIGVSASTSVLPMNTPDFLWDGLVGSPCCPRDSQESSPTPQFKSINSSALSFLYSSTLTSIHDYWKNYYIYIVLTR